MTDIIYVNTSKLVRSGSEGCPDTGHGGKRILRAGRWQAE
jgi:hypothetical protein